MNKPSFQPKKGLQKFGKKKKFQKKFKFDTVRVYYKTKPVKKMLKTSNFQIFWKYAIHAIKYPGKRSEPTKAFWVPDMWN